jgi:hypothetical protein
MAGEEKSLQIDMARKLFCWRILRLQAIRQKVKAHRIFLAFLQSSNAENGREKEKGIRGDKPTNVGGVSKQKMPTK